MDNDNGTKICLYGVVLGKQGSSHFTYPRALTAVASLTVSGTIVITAR